MFVFSWIKLDVRLIYSWTGIHTMGISCDEFYVYKISLVVIYPDLLLSHNKICHFVSQSIVKINIYDLDIHFKFILNVLKWQFIFISDMKISEVSHIIWSIKMVFITCDFLCVNGSHIRRDRLHIYVELIEIWLLITFSDSLGTKRNSV